MATFPLARLAARAFELGPGVDYLPTAVSRPRGQRTGWTALDWSACAAVRTEAPLAGTPQACRRFRHMHKPFAHPILLRADRTRNVRTIDSADQAADFLMSEWSGERDNWHRDALDACLKVLEGYRSTIDAENAFREFAQKAGILERPVDVGHSSTGH